MNEPKTPKRTLIATPAGRVLMDIRTDRITYRGMVSFAQICLTESGEHAVKIFLDDVDNPVPMMLTPEQLERASTYPGHDAVIE